jgi:hypothetical protein
MPTRLTRRVTRRTRSSIVKGVKRRSKGSKKHSKAAALKSHNYLTNSEGQRRAIILDMNYYLKLLGEVHTLRALVKQRATAAGPSRGGRRSSR